MQKYAFLLFISAQVNPNPVFSQHLCSGWHDLLIPPEVEGEAEDMDVLLFLVEVDVV